MHTAEYEDKEDERPRSSVYIIVFWDGPHIREKIKKVCDSFSGSRVDLPPTIEIPKKLLAVQGEILNAQQVVVNTRAQLRK